MSNVGEADSNSPHVLIVEDDPIFGRALEAGLLLDGISVEWARDGRNVVRAFTRGRYDALLVDLGLPDISGFDVVREIRREDPEVPILIVTGEDAIATRIRGLDVGADDYLIKPFEMPELLARLRAVKRRRPADLPFGDIVLTPHEAAIVGLMLAHPQALPAAALATLLRRRGENVSITDVQACLLSLQTKFESRFLHVQDDLRTVH